MAAFHQAVADGADLIELDVRLTADGEFVVFHDRTLRRTTNGRGNIYRHSLSDLLTLDAGSWYAPAFSRERIPLLRHVLETFSPSVGLNIEVKTDGDPHRRTTTPQALRRVLRNAPASTRIIVSSFDHSFLRSFHRLTPSVPVGVLLMPLRDTRKRPSTLRTTMGARGVVVSSRYARPSFVSRFHRHRMFVAAYTVNTPRTVAKMLRADVDAVITDYPSRIIRALQNPV